MAGSFEALLEDGEEGEGLMAILGIVVDEIKELGATLDIWLTLEDDLRHSLVHDKTFGDHLKSVQGEVEISISRGKMELEWLIHLDKAFGDHLERIEGEGAIPMLRGRMEIRMAGSF